MKAFHHALKIDTELCIGCTHCMKVCPTQALRIRDGKAKLLPNKCIDCGECFRACPVSAIRIEEDDFNEIYNYRHRIALFPSVLVSQFPEGLPPEQVYSTLLEIGFTDVYEVEHAVDMLLEEMLKYQEDKKREKPIISTFCPAVVRLIQVKFPSLTQNMMLLKPPFDIAALHFRQQLEEKGYHKDDIGIFYITPCAAKIAAVKSPVGERDVLINGVINMDSLYNKLLLKIKNNKNNTCRVPAQNNLSERGILWSLTQGESDAMKGRSLAIDGIQNVMEFLEKYENGEIKDIDFLELRACDESCAGGVLNVNNRFLTVEMMKSRARQIKESGQQNAMHDAVYENQEYIRKEMQLVEPIRPRSMVKLDEDIMKALEKMQEKTSLMKVLPLFDCGACGSPTCEALAEDIVRGKATLDDCIFIECMKVYEDAEDKEDAKKIVEKIWGKDRINTYRYKRK